MDTTRDRPSSRRGGRRSSPPIAQGTIPIIDGRYQVEREIGRGGMGVIYLARDMGLGRMVALKLIKPELSVQQDVAEHFRREASALASVRHDNVVQIHAFGSHDDTLFFAMEYVKGRDLDEIIAEHREHGTVVPTNRALTILCRIASGLAAVHGAALVHRDVKPANIVIETGTGRPVLVDFGLAVTCDPGSALSPSAAGSPPYMSPEQWRNDGLLGPPADVYSFGVTAFELLTGALPFESDSAEELARMHFERLAPRISSVSPKMRVFDRVISRTLAKDPRARYDGFGGVIDALDAALPRWRSGSTDPSPSYPNGRDAGSELLRVLVVDDDDSFRRVATRAAQLAFIRRGALVSSARSGTEALTKAERATPHLVLMHLNMSDFDGIDTISRLRAMPNGADTRVLVVTDREDEAERWRFSVLGVEDFFAKEKGLLGLVQTVTELGSQLGWVRGVDEEAPPSSSSL